MADVHVLNREQFLNSAQSLFNTLEQSEKQILNLQQALLQTSIELALIGKPLKKISENLDFGFESEYFVVATFDLFDKSELFDEYGVSLIDDTDIGVVKSMIYSTFEECLGKFYIVYCCESSKYFGDIFINIPEIDGEEQLDVIWERLFEIATDTLRAIERFCGLKLYFSMSSVMSDFADVLKAKREAYQQLSRTMHSDGINRIAISVPPNSDPIGIATPYGGNPDTKTRSQLERLFFQKLLQHDFDCTHALIDQIMTLNMEEWQSDEATIQDIVSHLECVIRVVSLPKEVGKELYAAVRNLYGVNSIRELRSAVVDFFRLLETMSGNQFTESNPIAQIKQYIVDHHQDPNISLFSISDTFGINQSYVSRMFKTYYNIGILEFIHTLRLNDVREMLVSTDKSINEILTESGYTNRRTFDRIFKQNEGMTAATYRSKFKT